MNNESDKCGVWSERSGYGVPALAGCADEGESMPVMFCALTGSCIQPAKAGTPYLASPLNPPPSTLNTRPSSA
jgi:hypothetical protein